MMVLFQATYSIEGLDRGMVGVDGELSSTVLPW